LDVYGFYISIIPKLDPKEKGISEIFNGIVKGKENTKTDFRSKLIKGRS